MTEINLNEGRWFPQIQCGLNTNTGVFRFPNPNNSSPYQDNFRNNGNTPLIVRSLSMRFMCNQSGWGDASLTDLGTNRLVWRLMKDNQELIPYFEWFPDNNVAGSVALGYDRGVNTDHTTLWRLASPILLPKGSNVFVKYCGSRYAVSDVPSDVGLFFGITAENIEEHYAALSLFAVGRSTGRNVILSHYTGEITGPALAQLINVYDEDLDILAISMFTSGSHHLHALELQVGALSLGASGKPLWGVSEPWQKFVASQDVFDDSTFSQVQARLDLSYMPAGGQILMPGEGLVLDGWTTVNDDISLSYLIMEGYQKC